MAVRGDREVGHGLLPPASVTNPGFVRVLLVHQVGVGAVDGHLVPAEFLLRDDVKTLAEMEIESALKNKIDSSKYIPYFVTVDEAIAAGVTPEEISEAIQFITKYKSGRK